MKSLQKAPLFEKNREWGLFALGLLMILGLNLLHHFQSYKELTGKRFFDTEATVLKQYQKLNKRGKPYTVLKLSGNGLTFYTTTREELKPLVGKELALTLITDTITFRDFLGTFYAPAFNLSLQPVTGNLKNDLATRVDAQHQNPLHAELFNALFFASSISPALREAVSDWGISHLIALSGYHLGFLGAILFFLLRLPYTLLQSRFFPYRNRTFDLTFFSAVILFGYLLFTGAPPSLIRAFGMLAVGLFLFYRWIDLLSFATLFVTLGILLAFIPSLLFSVGFWFSAAGVFYIYLILHYTKGLKGWQVFILLNAFVFVAMMPVVHFFFEKFTYWQLLSPLLTMLFALFYPLSMLLHLFGFGGMMEPLLETLFSVPAERYEVGVSPWFLGLYLLLSFGAIFHRFLFYLYLAAAAGFLLYALF